MTASPVLHGRVTASPIVPALWAVGAGIFIAGDVLWLPDLLAHKAFLANESDFVFYRTLAERWLDTGQFYLPAQLTGPWHLVVMESVLYPPTALYLFVPFVWLPAIVWWIVPLGILGYAVYRLRPARWAWPILVLIAIWPRTVGSVLAGNTDIWIAAGVAGGFLWAWPAALVTLKPIFLPLALAGAPRRSWWIGMAAVVVLSLPFLGLWADYVTVARNGDVPLTYILPTLPIVLAPLVAWWARTERSRPALGS